MYNTYRFEIKLWLLCSGEAALCSSGKFNPKRRPQQFLFFKSFYVTELKKKNKKFRKYPMRENKDTNSLVCDAMLKIAKINLTHKSTNSDLAHLLD